MIASIHLYICLWCTKHIHKYILISYLQQLFNVILFLVLTFDKDWINISYVPETLVGAREEVMTETGFSKISWFHKGDFNVDRLFQCNVVSEMIRGMHKDAAVDTKKRGTHLSLAIWELGTGKWPNGTCYITSACTQKWDTGSRSEGLDQLDPQLEVHLPRQAQPTSAPSWPVDKKQTQLGSEGPFTSYPWMKNKGLLLYATKKYIYIIGKIS